MNILVIEDQPTELKLAHHVLTAAGNTVNDAGAAEQAMAAIVADRPDVILLDLGLPGADGIELVRQLKADPATRDILVVAVTSFPEKFPRTEALAAGCEAYLLKPLSTRTLPHDLSDLVAKGSQRDGE